MIFTDGSDLNGIERVQDIKYMKVLRYSLRVITAWPEKEIEGVESKYHIYKKCYTLFIEVICLLPGLLYIKNNFKVLSFFQIGHTYITVFMNIVAICRLILIFLQTYADTMSYFVNVIHLFNHRARSKHAKETHLLVHKMSHFFTVFVTGQMILGILLFNATPLCNNIVSGGFSQSRSQNFTFDHAVYYYLPFDYESDLNGYIVIFIFNWYISYICTSCICIMDLLLALIVFHAWGHLKILISSLEDFPRPKLEEGPNKYYAMYSSNEIKTVHLLLREYINHHCVITDFVRKISDTFGPILFVYFLFQQATGCLMLLQCSTLETEAVIRYGPMTLIFFEQVVQLYIIFELLGSLGDALPDAVYSIPWECMNSSQRKIFYVFLKRSQKPIKFKAMDVVNLGVETMTMSTDFTMRYYHVFTKFQQLKNAQASVTELIIKTSFSYFIMLRAFAE